MALTGFVIWLALLAAAGLCFPTRQRASGVFFILLGAWSAVMRLAAARTTQPLPWAAALALATFWLALGLRQIVRRPA